MGLIHFFFPHKRNNYKALLLKLPALLSYPVIILIVLLSLSTLTSLKPGILGVVSNIDTKSVIEETNHSREKSGAPTLRENAKLSEAAQKKAQDMISKGYWAHITPTGRTPWDFIRETGYSYTAAGENLARDFSDVPSLMSAWLASQSHKDNLLNREFSEIGIGVAQGQVDGRPTIFVVQMFATPAPSIQLAQREQEKPKTVEPVRPGEKPVTIAQELELEKQVTPSLTPSPAPQVTQEPEVIDVSQVAYEKPKLDYFATQKVISISLISLLAILFIIDFVFLRVRRLARSGGHPLFHLLFLLLALFFVWYSQAGLVL